MNEHYLQEKFKEIPSKVLELKLWQLESFSGSPAMVKMIGDELVRRKRRATDEKTEV